MNIHGSSVKVNMRQPELQQIKRNVFLTPNNPLKKTTTNNKKQQDDKAYTVRCPFLLNGVQGISPTHKHQFNHLAEKSK